MGKGVNLINGVITGKVGAQVGFKTQDSKRPQGVRAYQPNVRNPKSYAQAKQRAKLIPANTFYDRIEAILNHAFIPKGNATKNRRRFMSLAMKNTEIPFVPKGSSWLPFNVPYQLSEGSLGLDELCKTKYAADGKQVEFANINLPGAATAEAMQSWKVADFSDAILTWNPELQEGYELTFVGIACPDDGQQLGAMVAYHGSIVLDKGDTVTPLLSALGENFDLTCVDDSGDKRLCMAFTLNTEGYGSMGFVAGAMIISAKNKNTWRYTNSFLAMTSWGVDGFDLNIEAVIESYMDSSNTESDLILQQADNNVSNGVVRIVSVTNETYTPSPTVAGATYSKSNAAVATYSNGQRKVILNGDVLVNHANDTYTGITVTVDGETSPLIVDATTWDDAPSVQLSEVQAAGF